MGWMLGPLMIIGGLHFGATVVMIEGVPDHPDADRLWRIVERNRVTVLGIAPTAARGLRARTNDARPDADLRSLRAFASTGEAWDEPTWHWLFETVGRVAPADPQLHRVAPRPAAASCRATRSRRRRRPRSAGPLPGMDVDVFDADGKSTSEIGELVVRNTWPGMTHSFWHDDERYLDTYWSRWPDVWVHGDLASVDADGYWHIHGRSDDTLKIGGRRVGPAEIESALVAQPGVAEAAVIGVPDEMKGQRVVAFVVARPGAAEPQPKRARSQRSSQMLGKALAPSRVHVVSGPAQDQERQDHAARDPRTLPRRAGRRPVRARSVDAPRTHPGAGASDARKSLIRRLPR